MLQPKNFKSGDVFKRLSGQNVDFLFDSIDQNIEIGIEEDGLESYFDPRNSKLTVTFPKTGFFELKFAYRRHVQDGWIQTDIMCEVHVDPAWLSDAIVYNVFLRAFGAEDIENLGPGQGGTFQDLVDHMDELLAMGINVIYLNPFHLIGELYRKYNPTNHLPYYLQPGSPYSIKDPKSIDPEVAFDHRDSSLFVHDAKKQFEKLISAAHHRGVRVIMDLVFNHTAHDFVLQRIYPEWFLYKENITSAQDPYIWPEEVKLGKPWGDAKHTVVPYDHGEFSWTDTAQLNWEYMLPPAPNDPPPNTKKREMYEYFKSVPKYWIREFGIDGFRCDVAYKIPSDFWRECIQEAKAEAKLHKVANRLVDGDIVFVAESFDNDLDILLQSGFGAVYGDYSNKIFSPINLKGYLDYIYNISNKYFVDGARWFLFPECHDFHRVTSKLVPAHVRAQSVEKNMSEIDELAIRGSVSRWVLTACLPGIPMVFNGFEKVEWHPVDHVAYSKINWDKHTDINSYVSKINSIRHSCRALKEGKYRYLDLPEGLDASTKLFGFVRYVEDEIVLVFVNMDIENEVSIEKIHIPQIGGHDFSGKYNLHDLLTDEIYSRIGDNITVVLGPGQSHIFRVNFAV